MTGFKTKRGIWTALLFAGLSSLAVCCADGSYYGYTDEDVNNIRSGKGSSVPERITLVVGDYGRSSNVTKGGDGAVSERGDWSRKGARLRVYAFRKDSSCYRAVPGQSSSESYPVCLIDASLDVPGSAEGRLASFSEPEYSLFWPLSYDYYGEKLYYPKADVSYDFFAYSTGGIEIDPSTVRRKDVSVSFPIKIDGAADLMYAKATVTESQKMMLPSLGLSAIEQAEAVGRCYSNWSAKLGIVPVLSFQHALTRISFDLYPAEQGCNDVMIDHIEVMSRDSCIFTVACSDSVLARQGVDFSNDAKDAIFLLTEENGTALNDTIYHTDYHGDFSEDILTRPHVRVGGCFLLPSEPSYTFVLYLKKKGYVSVTPSSITVSPKKGGNFLAGNNYVVRVAVHDLTAVDFDVDVDPWENAKGSDNKI